MHYQQNVNKPASGSLQQYQSNLVSGNNGNGYRQENGDNSGENYNDPRDAGNGNQNYNNSRGAGNGSQSNNGQYNYDNGYNRGYDTGYDNGYWQGYDRSFNDGYEEGYRKAREEAERNASYQGGFQNNGYQNNGFQNNGYQDNGFRNNPNYQNFPNGQPFNNGVPFQGNMYPQGQYPGNGYVMNPNMNYPDRMNRPIKNKVLYGVLGIVMGGVGVHKFYMGKTTAGVLSCVFCWTGIPAIIGLVEGIVGLTQTDAEFEDKHKCRLR